MLNGKKTGMLLCIVTILCICLQMVASAASDAVSESLTLTETAVGYSLEGTVSSDEVSSVQLVAAVYDGTTNALRTVKPIEASFTNNSAKISASITCTPEANDKIKLFILDTFKNLKPLAQVSEKKIQTENEVKTVCKANGVVLSWDKIDGVQSYEIYRDNVKIATVEDTTYNDIYFETIEQMLGETSGMADGITTENISESHSYYVVAGKYKSKSAEAKASTEKIRYFSLSGVTDAMTKAVDDINNNAKANKITIDAQNYKNTSGSWVVDGRLKAVEKYSALTELTTDTKDSANEIKTQYGIMSNTGWDNATPLAPVIEEYKGKQAFRLVTLKNYMDTTSSDSYNPGYAAVGFTVNLFEGEAESETRYTCLVNADLKPLTPIYKITTVFPVGTVVNGSFGNLKVVTDNAASTVKTQTETVGFHIKENDTRDYATYIYDITTKLSANSKFNVNAYSPKKANYTYLKDQTNITGDNGSVHSIALVPAEDFLRR